MNIARILTSALLLSSLLAVGCSTVEPSAEDGSDEAWAAVEAGTCTPDCTGRTCGLDPVCGVSCGTCSTGETCDADVGQCQPVCVPDCSGRTCGVDPICGVSCGECGAGEACTDGGVCKAEPKPRHCPGGKHGQSGNHGGGKRGGGWYHW